MTNIWAPPGATVRVHHRRVGGITFAVVDVKDGRRPVSDHTFGLGHKVSVNGSPVDLSKPTDAFVGGTDPDEQESE